MEKYLVASSGDTLDSKVSGRFGHSRYFMVIDPLTMEYEVFKGVSTYEDQSVEKLITPAIKKVIVGNIGPSAYSIVLSYGCKVYLCRNLPVNKAVRKVKDGETPELKVPTLKKSIHSGRKAGDNNEGPGEGTGKGKGKGKGIGSGHRVGRVTGKGIGRGRGAGKKG